MLYDVLMLFAYNHQQTNVCYGYTGFFLVTVGK